MSIELATERLNKALVLLEGNIQGKGTGANDQKQIGALQSENTRLRETISHTLGLLDGLIKRMEEASFETAIK